MHERSLFSALIGDGRPLLAVTALALLFAGAFALFLTITRQFLPHDVHYLEMTAAELCAVADCRINAFMFHDRAAFGGALIAIGVLYLWLIEFPLRSGEAWAWGTLAVSGVVGFLSFLAYLGYGYLDSWHGVGTVALLPLFVTGLVRTRGLCRAPGYSPEDTAARWRQPSWGTAVRVRVGRTLLLATGLGMVLAGATILVIGMTTVFVPDDLAFMRVSVDRLNEVSGRLVPLIAHDRAGFGGGLLTTGLLVTACVWFARPGRALRQALWLAGAAGFGCAIGVHLAVGYTAFPHLAPAVAGSMLFVAGMALTTPAGPETGDGRSRRGRRRRALSTARRYGPAADRSP